MKKEQFVDSSPTLETSWRSIILLGRNVASYKFALAKSLLGIDTTSSEIEIAKIALPFAKNICAHLKENKKQITSRSSKYLSECMRFNEGVISKDQLQHKTVNMGFNNVIDAFHVVARQETTRFFIDNRSSNDSIILTDNFYKLKERDVFGNLENEAESRWNLWETAISLNVNPSLLQIMNDQEKGSLFIYDDTQKRRDVTSSKDALSGYQKGRCFYCYRNISLEQGNEDSCDVDHFFPHILKSFGIQKIDQIWNLVLACRNCNRGKDGKFEKIPDIEYVEALYKRNNYYIESHLPLRETLINQTGSQEHQRRVFLQGMFNSAVGHIPVRWKPKELQGEPL